MMQCSDVYMRLMAKYFTGYPVGSAHKSFRHIHTRHCCYTKRNNRFARMWSIINKVVLTYCCRASARQHTILDVTWRSCFFVSSPRGRVMYSRIAIFTRWRFRHSRGLIKYSSWFVKWGGCSTKFSSMLPAGYSNMCLLSVSPEIFST